MLRSLGYGSGVYSDTECAGLLICSIKTAPDRLLQRIVLRSENIKCRSLLVESVLPKIVAACYGIIGYAYSFLIC